MNNKRLVSVRPRLNDMTVRTLRYTYAVLYRWFVCLLCVVNVYIVCGSDVLCVRLWTCVFCVRLVCVVRVLCVLSLCVLCFMWFACWCTFFEYVYV